MSALVQPEPRLAKASRAMTPEILERDMWASLHWEGHKARGKHLLCGGPKCDKQGPFCDIIEAKACSSPYGRGIVSIPSARK